MDLNDYLNRISVDMFRPIGAPIKKDDHEWNEDFHCHVCQEKFLNLEIEDDLQCPNCSVPLIAIDKKKYVTKWPWQMLENYVVSPSSNIIRNLRFDYEAVRTEVGR